MTAPAPELAAYRPPVVGPRVELAHYTISSGERILYGQRVDRKRTADRPTRLRSRPHRPRRPHMERDGRKALQALIEDYVEQAQHHDQVPMLLNPVN